ncbi:hypothetical protein [Bacteroides uniformis]|uniref:Uncharacterized protein n=1 Tax=Bacteroides uniformis TaxID=820 RepID=A0A6I0LRU1_BACUN|nr:hypothetical protein [Bacteroides uniformis]KAB4253889.1 hypothetical protein GAP49_05920 [Bacteroides uniformis]KAB4254034.1 hypothetical protein GAO04_06055 [Bacteroides uniformis]KAB4257602.1 hypothetical protein GAP48_03775 [Bacteroides uniformis]KAB4260190.1 hypothetical protein GAP40_13755 [Bacteroides uniformis]
MQTAGIQAGGTACQAYHGANGKFPVQGCDKTEKNYGAKRCRNAFLNTRLRPIPPRCVTREWDGVTYNYITQENYEFLRDSYLNYAELLGVEARHKPAKSIGENIIRLYAEMDGLIGDGLNVNLEYERERLYFALWKYHRWGEYTLYWFPVKFLECLSPELRRIAITFLHELMVSNRIETMNDEEDTDYILECEAEAAAENDEKERDDWLRKIESYTNGKIYRLLERVRTKSYYKNLPKKLANYQAGNDFEKRLVDGMRAGLDFIIPDRSIMQYAYDPFFDEEPDFTPMYLERQIRFIYDIRDGITSSLEEYFNNSLQETYEITPVTVYKLSPETDKLFFMDDYPERFFKWADKFIELTA